MREAHVDCPHCGKPIVVREVTVKSDVSPENAKKIFAAADEMFAAVEKSFAKIFDRNLWR